MRKKLLSMIMCVLMVISFMPTTSFANSVNVSENPETGTCTHEAKIGNVHYDTLAEAILAATGDDAVVTLMGNATISDSTEVKNLTIADGATLSFSNTGKLTVSGKLTVEGTLDLTGASADQDRKSTRLNSSH